VRRNCLYVAYVISFTPDRRRRSSPKLADQRGQLDQIIDPQTRSTTGHDDERVLWRGARPAHGQRYEKPLMIPVVHPTLTVMVALIEGVELLAEQRVEGVRDPDTSGRFPWADCS